MKDDVVGPWSYSTFQYFFFFTKLEVNFSQQISKRATRKKDSIQIQIEQDLGRKCSAWKDFGLGLVISLHSSLRDRVKWDLGLGVNW